MLDLVHFFATRLPRIAAPFFPDMLWRIDTSAKVLYITFDDGPTDRVTQPLLDLLACYEAQATWFMLGAQAERHPALVRAVAASGHGIGNHSFSHPDGWMTKAEIVEDELVRTTAVLEHLVQRPLRHLRPPYGHFTRPMRRWCRQHRQRCTMWDIGPGDYLPSATPSLVRDRILRAVRPGAILVLHDNPNAETNVLPALAHVLPHLKARGWQFAALPYSSA